MTGPVAALVVVVVALLAVCTAVMSPIAPSVATHDESLAIGQQGMIAIDLAAVAVDLRTMEELVKEGSPRGEIVVAGRAFLLSYGTKVEVIERTPTALRIRVGEGPREGQGGWVPNQWVKR